MHFNFSGAEKKGYIEYYPPTRPPQILIKNVLKNCFFSAFGKILVLVSAFSIQILIINVLKNCFLAFGKILVLVNAFSIQILIKKVLKN